MSAELTAGVQAVIDRMVEQYEDNGVKVEKAHRDHDYDVSQGAQGAQSAVTEHVDALCDLIGVDRPDWYAIDDRIERSWTD